MESINAEITEANDVPETDFLEFADLSLNEEQLAEVKGGPGGGFGCTWCGVNGGNHNETTVSDEEEKAEDDFLEFADLSLNDEQLDQLKGGPGGGFSCTWCQLQGNHNETVSEDFEDNEDDSLEFADLSLNDEQLDQLKGGPGGGFGCTWCTLQGNHNETAAKDDAE